MVDRLLQALADEPFLIGLLSELTEQPWYDVQTRFEGESLDMGCQVREAFRRSTLTPHVWDERLDAFYTQTDSFLFETLVWNRHPKKIEMRRWIIDFLKRNGRVPSRILTFGDGLGIDSIALAAAGHQVDYFEVSTSCVRFAQRLGDRVGIQPHYIDSVQQLSTDSYDIVVCLDVLEHVPDPPSTVAMLAGLLRPGGQLIVHAPFWYIHPAVITHLAANRTYSGDLRRLYRDNDLHPIDGRLFWMPLVLEKRTPDSQQRFSSVASRMTVLGSGLLLSIARFWSLPHVWIARNLFLRSRQSRFPQPVQTHAQLPKPAAAKRAA